MVENALDYEGLKRYDEKSKSYVDDKISSLNSAKIDKTTVASSSTLGLVKSGTDISVDSNGNVSVNDNSHKHTVSNISDLTASASELNVLDGITATTDELNYVDGVTSNIQTQLNSKAPIASPTLTGTPKAPTASVGTNNTQIATTGFVQTAISNLVDSAPETLNTLNELSAALGDDPNFATTVANRIGNTESNITKIIDGTTTVGKALKDADGNVITETYATKEEIENIPTSSGGDIVDTVTGKNATATDSTDAPIISLKEKGYTEQQTYSGKNLIVNNLTTTTVNGVTFTVNEDGSITANGTATADASVTIWKHPKIEKGKSYILSGGSSDKKNIKLVVAWGGSNHTYTSKGNEVSFTVDGDITATSITMTISSGETANNFTFYPMIRKAEITDNTYEPYTGGIASPNPDYPQEIVGMDKVSVKTTGKNIFGGLALAQALVDSGSTNVVIDESKGTVAFEHNTNYNDIEKSKLFSDFKENTQYTFILNGSHVNVGISVNFTNLIIYYTDGTFVGVNLATTGEFQYIFVSDKNKTIDSLKYGYSEADKTTLNYEQCGIFEGVITADDFEPYTETLAEIDLTEPLYEGDYIEYRADGTGVLHRSMASVVINGKKGILAYHITTYGTFAVSKTALGIYNTISHGTKVICDYLLNETLSSLVSGKKGICNLDDEFIYINLIGSASTVDEAKAWLAANPITVVYELAESTEIELTAEQLAQFKQLRTFEPITNIFSDGETTIQYYKANDNGGAVGGLQERVEKNEIEIDDIVNGTTTVGKATTATKAGTATYATSAGSASKATSATSATYATTATSAGSASKATSATSATYASTATKAGTATYATNSGTATYSSNGAKATSATSATYATTSTKAGTATYATNSGTATYAGSAGSATTAVALTTSAGSATQPVYFSGGKPSACSYTLSKSVPSNAVFTDTVTTVSSDSNSNSTTIAASTSLVYSLKNRLSESLVSKETINIDSLSLSGGGHSTITSEEISKSGYTLVGANFFLRGSYAENIIASFTIGGSNTKIYNFAFYNPSDYNISAYGYVDLIYVANSL